MVIDMRPFEESLSYEKNGKNLGIAFAGLNDLNEVYPMFSLLDVGDTVKVVNYEVIEGTKQQ